jgi:hypothetical protein
MQTCVCGTPFVQTDSFIIPAQWMRRNKSSGDCFWLLLFLPAIRASLSFFIYPQWLFQLRTASGQIFNANLVSTRSCSKLKNIPSFTKKKLPLICSFGLAEKCISDGGFIYLFVYVVIKKKCIVNVNNSTRGDSYPTAHWQHHHNVFCFMSVYTSLLAYKARAISLWLKRPGAVSSFFPRFRSIYHASRSYKFCINTTNIAWLSTRRHFLKH